MMDNFITLIVSSKDLLLHCTELCDKLNKDFINGDLSNDIKEKVLNEMLELFKKLIRNIISAKNETIENININFLQSPDVKVLLIDIVDRTIFSNAVNVIKDTGDTKSNLNHYEKKLDIIDQCDINETSNDIYHDKETILIENESNVDQLNTNLFFLNSGIYQENEKSHINDGLIIVTSDEVKLDSSKNSLLHDINHVADDALSQNICNDKEFKIKQCYIVIEDIKLIHDTNYEKGIDIDDSDDVIIMNGSSIIYDESEQYDRNSNYDKVICEDKLKKKISSNCIEVESIQSNLSPMKESCVALKDKTIECNDIRCDSDDDCIIIQKAILKKVKKVVEIDIPIKEQCINVKDGQGLLLKCVENKAIDKERVFKKFNTDMYMVVDNDNIYQNSKNLNEKQLNINTFIESEYDHKSVSLFKQCYVLIEDIKNLNINYDDDFSNSDCFITDDINLLEDDVKVKKSPDISLAEYIKNYNFQKSPFYNDLNESQEINIDIDESINNVNNNDNIRLIDTSEMEMLTTFDNEERFQNNSYDMNTSQSTIQKNVMLCNNEVNGSIYCNDSDHRVIETQVNDDVYMKETSSSMQNNVETNREDITKNKDELNVLKSCRVPLNDVLKYKSISDEIFYNNLEFEINKLSQIPKFKNKQSSKDDKLKKLRNNLKKSHTKKHFSSVVIESESNDSISDLESIDSQSETCFGNNEIIDSCLSSTESDQSSQSSINMSKSKASNSKLHLSNDLVHKLLTKKLKISLISNNMKKKDITVSPSNVVCLSSDTANESDASLNDLQICDSHKRRKKQKLNVLNKKRKVDNNEENYNGKRKNIRKIITKSKLSEATKSAEQLEIDRRMRIEEKQKIYNISMESKAYSCLNFSPLVMEKDQNGESLIEIHRHIAEKLKPHQAEAVHFMYECVIENLQCLLKSQQEKEENKSSSVGGCIIAHCMGLGKTLSLIAFMHTMLTNTILNLDTCIIVCPVNTALNWKKEWEMWMPPDIPVNIFELCSNENKKNRFTIIRDWHKKGGVLIIGYEMFRMLTTTNSRPNYDNDIRETMQEALVNPGADFIVCDEGHLLKNAKSAISKIINKVKTRYRIVLTGTPLQNRLIEYHTMVNFVKPNLLGSQKEFLNRFANPISNGQHINSTLFDVNIMKKRSHILYKTLDGCVHRRDYSALVKYLPPKYEYVIKIRMSSVQIALYRAYLSTIEFNKNKLFQDQHVLSRVWTHPFIICMHQEIQDKKMFFAETDNESLINDSNDDNEKSVKTKYSKKTQDLNNYVNLISDDSDDNEIDKMEIDKDSISVNSDSEEVKLSKTRTSTQSCCSDIDDIPKLNFELENLSETSISDKHWWSEIIDTKHEHQIEISGKLTILFQILRKAEDIGDKVIVFSHSLLVLDIIEKYLSQLHFIAENVNNDFRALNKSLSNSRLANITGVTKAFDLYSEIGYNTWEKGVDYDRMDGSTQIFTRSDIQARFNSEKEHRLRLFLISTRAGGMGINLVAANRVVIFDVSWNPSNDMQAIFRSYRFGQNKPVYVYRMVSQGTMEEKMYERQVTKQSLSLRVIDEQQIDRYFKEEDLKSLYEFKPDIYNPDKEGDTPILPKDRFLAELIQEFPQWIFSYHEHDSLLQNNEDEELTEIERQEAWKEFEDEKCHGIRPIISHLVQTRFDQHQFAEDQINQMKQQYPQFAALYSQNFTNLLRYIINKQPDLQFNQSELSCKMNTIFFMSVQKYNNNMTSTAPSANASSSKKTFVESTTLLN